ncbi:MAG: DegT/DnrJ/EryC1/StrS family aminotransferase [Chloroflexi bacterium]|nr:DegT/DnrJ/EryC1/StrS family aminotransferase [Chloroflexota bacterium]
MIPFVDLRAQYHSIKDEIDRAVAGVLESSQFVLGKEVAAFEEEFAAYVRTRHAVAVNSGTSALHLSLLAFHVGPGDEVITTPFTFVATAAAIRYVGARPVFVDIDPLTYNLDPRQIEAAITERTRAILPVHLYGQPADLDSILTVARRHHLAVIEDACQAHGAEYRGERAGSLGDVGCFSFYPGKNLGAYGEGGILVTNDQEVAHTARLLRDWGQEHRYHHDLAGFNYRMEAFQGAILRVKLKYLEAWTEARRAHAALYSELLSGTRVVTPFTMPEARHVFHVYAVAVAHRETVQSALESRSVHTGIHYPIPVHLQRAYTDPAFPEGSLPGAEKAAQQVLSLPMFPELREDQIRAVAAALREVTSYASV